jgi:competence ComEA-like helix-hairpin-helix protein
MFRTVLALAAVMFLLAALPSPAVAAQTKTAARSAAKPASTATVNLNTASAVELETLPGVGAKTAALIVEFRQKNGPFKKIEDILESSRSCPYLLTISRLSARRTVARNR